MITIFQAKSIIRRIASMENVSVNAVYADMEKAISFGFNHPDRKIRAKWEEIPKKGMRPTPEEVIVWASDQLQRSIE